MQTLRLLFIYLYLLIILWRDLTKVISILNWRSETDKNHIQHPVGLYSIYDRLSYIQYGTAKFIYGAARPFYGGIYNYGSARRNNFMD
jgi:hypothetical protein